VAGASGGRREDDDDLPGAVDETDGAEDGDLLTAGER
jgi:hypothetical protein